VQLLLYEAFAGTHTATAAERDHQERTGTGHLAVMQPAFGHELVRRREVGFLLAREPRVAQNYSLEHTDQNYSDYVLTYDVKMLLAR